MKHHEVKQITRSVRNKDKQASSCKGLNSQSQEQNLHGLGKQ